MGSSTKLYWRYIIISTNLEILGRMSMSAWQTHRSKEGRQRSFEFQCDHYIENGRSSAGEYSKEIIVSMKRRVYVVHCFFVWRLEPCIQVQSVVNMTRLDVPFLQPYRFDT